MWNFSVHSINVQANCYFRAEINIRPWEHVLKEMEKGNRRIKWNDREPYAYWKGNPFVAETRQDLLKCNVSTTQDWNARLYVQVYLYIYIYIGSLTLIITPLQNDDDIYFPPFELTLVTYICRIGFKNLNKDSITQTWQVNAHIGSSNSPADLPRIFCTHICLIFCTYMQKLTQAHKLVTPLYAYEN